MTEEAVALRAESGDKFDVTGSPSRTSLSSDHDGHYLVPSPVPTRRARTSSASERAQVAPVLHGKITKFCREKGHGFITPHNGGVPIFLHISDIEGDTVPKEGDEVIFKTILMPPKMEKMQAVHVQIVAMKPVKHEHWEDTSIHPH